MIACIKFRPLEKGALRGFADLKLDSGLVLHDCMLIESGDRRWVNLPSKQMLDKDRQLVMKDGKVVYTPIVSIADKTRRELFSNTALNAIDAFRGGQAPTANAPGPDLDGEIPF
jgi:DNA-binding cell septation regulator SpoVG